MTIAKIEWDRGDGSVKGLHLKTTPAGRKSYYLVYRNKGGVQRRPKIGDVGDITLATARQIARQWHIEIAAGGDPSADRKADRNERTIQDVFDAVVSEHWSDEKFEASGWASESKRIWEKSLKKKFGPIKVKEVTAPLIREWHRHQKNKPNSANRSKAVLSKVLSFAEEKGWREPQSNPCFSVPNHPEKQRDRVATPDELKRIVQVLDDSAATHPREVAFLYLLIFTGSRPRAIERAKKSQLSEVSLNDQNVGVLAFEGKTGREVVIVPAQAMRALQLIPEGNGDLLVGIKMPRKFWEKVRTLADCEDLWARDFRRTFASIGLQSGISIDKIGRTLNHRAQQTTLTYARLVEKSRINTTTQIADAISSIVKPDELDLTGTD